MMQKIRVKNPSQKKSNKTCRCKIMGKIPKLERVRLALSRSSTHAVAVVKQSNPFFNKQQGSKILNQVQDNLVLSTKPARGFTLIELLVVVLIICILAAVALPQYQKAVAKSRGMEILSIGRAIVLAQKSFFLANGHYATSLADLDINFPNNITNNYTISLYDDSNPRANISSKKGYGFWDFSFLGYACCIARETDTLANHVCASITGNNSPNKGNEVYNYYSMRFL